MNANNGSNNGSNNMKKLNLTNADLAKWEARLDVALASNDSRTPNTLRTDPLGDTTMRGYARGPVFTPAKCAC